MKRNFRSIMKGSTQRGFTLVEVALVLVIAGIIVVGVLKGTDLLNKARVSRMVSDIKGLQATLLEAKVRAGRLPGDCDNDGFLEIAAPVVTQVYAASGTVTSVNQYERDSTLLTVCAQPTANIAVDTTLGTLVAGGGTATVNGDAFNLVWNELRRSGVVDGMRTNLELARHTMDDVMLAASVSATAGTGLGFNRANVIVVYNLPIWMAEAIEAEIDGTQRDYGNQTATATTGSAADGPACTGRVRLWKGPTTANVTVGTTSGSSAFSCTTPQYNGATGTNNRDDIVSIFFQFDTDKLQF